MTDPRRVYSDGLIVLGQGSRRVYADGLIVLHGENARRIYADGLIVLAAEEAAPAPPGTPTLTAEAQSPTTARLTMAPGENADYHELYQDGILIETFGPNLEHPWPPEE
jgi:hypothetical protein